MQLLCITLLQNYTCWDQLIFCCSCCVTFGKCFILIQDGLFRGCSRMGGSQKDPLSLKSVTHICNDETWYSYILPKEYAKNVWTTWHTTWALLTPAFFHRKLANFAISRNTDIDCNLIHNSIFLNFSCVFKDYFNKYSYNFDDVSKNGYARPS